MSISPAFGQADMTNCDRELIQFAGSVQPHGLLLVLQEPQLRIVQASRSASHWLGRPLDWLLLSDLHQFPGDTGHQLQALCAEGDLREPHPLRCSVGTTQFEGAAHRVADDMLVLELEPVDPPPPTAPSVQIDGAALLGRLGALVQRISEASSLGTLADGVVQDLRDIVGYDRVMVYRFDPDGHGKIIAEARDPRLEPLLGHRYPATDIPQRARDLYLRNRVRVLVDVHYEPSVLVPHLLSGKAAGPQGELDMSLCYLRSMSPLHLQYLMNMGVTATLVISLVREGRLWGLVACHHYQPRNLSYAVRAACELLGEAISTRIAAIENYARAQVAIQVRRLEQRLVEATSTEGDWRLALFRNPRTLLQPLDATGAVLFHDGEVLTCGEVPSTPELRALRGWIEEQEGEGPFGTASIGKASPPLASLTPTASGVLAVKLSSTQPDYLVWLRKEQLQSYTWAGDPTKPIIDNDPLKLSPRRSFAAWSEIVRGTSAPWAPGELALASAFGDALIDIIVQVHAVRLLIAEHQLNHVRDMVAGSKEPVVVASASGGAFYANAAFFKLAQREPRECRSLDELVALLDAPGAAHQMIGHVRAEQRSWRGEMALRLRDGESLSVSLRAEPVPARDGSMLGFIFIFGDLTAMRLAREARMQLEASLSRVGRGAHHADGGDLIGAIIANAGLAAMDIADGGATPAIAPLLHGVEAATARATTLYTHIRTFSNARR
jgi:light-regulated signal transduction histidine kinase (bacteriophytochrome)